MALRPVSRMEGYSLPEGTYDVRGWSVRTELDQAKAGEVEDLLLDAEGRLRYLHVDLGFLKKHVLVPLDRAYADPEEEVVWLEAMSRDRLEHMPEYGGDPEAVPSAFERRLTEFYHESTAGGLEVEAAEADRPARAALAAEAESDPDAEVPLSRLADIDDYQVAGDADPRGWTLVSGDGREIGRVNELLVDRSELTARYLDVALDEAALGLEPVDRHILVPVEQVRLEQKKKRVAVAGLLPSDFTDYPQYGGLPLRRTHTRAVDRLFDRSETGAGEWRSEQTLRHFFNPTRPRARDRMRRETAAETSESIQPGEEVTVRVQGGDVVIEKRPTGRGGDHG